MVSTPLANRKLLEMNRYRSEEKFVAKEVRIRQSAVSSASARADLYHTQVVN